MSARDEIREQIRTRLVGYVDTSDAEAVRLLDTFAAEVLRGAADEIEAIDAHPNARALIGDIYRALAVRLRVKADDAEIGGA